MTSCVRQCSLVMVLVGLAACGLLRSSRQMSAAGCHPRGAAYEESAGADVGPQVKVASAVRQVAQRLCADGITAENAAARQTESYSTPLVRVDQHGNLHVVLLVTTADPQVEPLLEQHGVRIEFVHAKLRMIQAWVPFERLEEIAALPFVRSIRPPNYAIRR